MDDDELIRTMYEQPDDAEEDDGPREQPIQLRLAGKATIVTLAGRQIAIPKMEYVEMLERRLMDAEAIITEQAALLKKYGMQTSRNAMMANKRITDLGNRAITRRDS